VSEICSDAEGHFGQTDLFCPHLGRIEGELNSPSKGCRRIDSLKAGLLARFLRQLRRPQSTIAARSARKNRGQYLTRESTSYAISEYITTNREGIWMFMPIISLLPMLQLLFFILHVNGSARFQAFERKARTRVPPAHPTGDIAPKTSLSSTTCASLCILSKNTIPTRATKRI
jgi:hypothetical protein